MWGIGLVAMSVALFAGADGPQGDEARGDQERLQGSWAMVSLEINGEKAREDEVKVARLFVEGDRYTPVFDERIISESFTLRPEMTPRAVDFTYTDGPRKGETVKGIYKLEGDTYTMCRAIKADDARPREFATRSDSGLALVVWRRITPADVARRRAVDVERKALDGTWVGVIGLRDGAPIVEDEMKQLRLTISGDRYTLERGDKTDRGTLVIDPTARPKTIDIVIGDGEFKGQTWQGIYAVVDDVHKACFAPEGKGRPKRFASEPDSGHVLWVFSRAKP